MAVTTEVDRVSYRPVRLVGALLVLQAAGLVGLVAYGGMLRIGWERMGLWSELRSSFETLAVGGIFLAAATVAGVAARCFLFMRRRGWLLAALAQTLALGTCLVLYSELEPRFVYPVMLYCIVMILYLNSRYVRDVFHPAKGRVALPRDVA